MINLTKEQSIQLEKTGECWHVEPLKEQPILENDWYFYKNIKFNKKAIIEELVKYRQYRPGQKVKVNYNHRKTASGKDTYTQIDAVVMEIKEPCRVQDIDNGLKYDILNKDIFYDNPKDDIGPEEIEILLKDYFNKIFAEPKAIQCSECKNGKKYDYDLVEYEWCSNCKGTGISHYIFYVYDGKSKIMTDTKTIVNPWVEIIKIKRT